MTAPGVSFRPSLPVFAGGWRASRVRLPGWEAPLAAIELRKGPRRAPLIAVVEVDLTRMVLLGKLPIGIDRELAERRLVSAVASRVRGMTRRSAA